GAQFSSWG
uniref:Kinin-4 n=1 Tax=Periplaneta americana TaxID=6978 RepID=KINI4_PERAM|nr:RecName: Full=Kinin-4; AltName: Full=Pea-K-4 [Periplaneta americana]